MLGLSLGIAVSNGFARFAYGLILPAMRADLGWTYAQAGWINTANALGYLAGAALTFVLLRRRAPPAFFVLGIVGTTASLLASGLAESFWLLTLWRVAAGLFGAPTLIAGGALAAQVFPDQRRTALAVALFFGGGGGVGMMLSGALLPALFATTGPYAWPVAWMGLGLASVACSLAAIAALLRLVRVGAAALSDGTNVVPTGPLPVAPTRLPIARMGAALLGYALYATGYIVYVTFLVALMHDLSAGPWLVSIVWIAVGLAIVASPFLWGGVLARFASGLPLAAASAVTGLGTLLPLVWESATGLIASGLLFGVAVFIAPAAVTTFSRRNLAAPLQASGIALFTIVFAVGQTLGPVAAGAIGDAFGSIRHGLAAAGAILLAGALVALAQRQLSNAGDGPLPQGEGRRCR